MNKFKKLFSLIICTILLLTSFENISYAAHKIPNQKPIKTAVFLNDINNLLNIDIQKSLENVQKENQNKIVFTI